jgi:Retroviral aspartyl protease
MENEHNCIFNVKETDFSFRPSFLAMVTARIQGSILDFPSTMLIDNGSELNIMVQLVQSKLELPMDPSGKDWLLRGVSGHQVNLVGLCHNVPLEVGGVPLPHNFFITSDHIGQKDIILGQPWLFSYSARIDYDHGAGMNLQVWREGDRASQSVRVTLPIMSAPRNVLPIEAIKPCMRKGSMNSLEVVPANDILEFLSTVTSVFTDVESDLKKLRPTVNTSEVLNFAMESPEICEALQRAFYSQNLIRETGLECQLMKTLIWDGYTFNVAATCSEDIARFVLGNRKYKPVGQKVHLVASYNPDSCPLVFTPLSIGELPVLPFRPIELENLQYTE